MDAQKLVPISVYLLITALLMASLYRMATSRGRSPQWVWWGIVPVPGLIALIILSTKPLLASAAAEFCSFCGTPLSSFNRAVGTRICTTCVDGESPGMKLIRLVARMLGVVVALGGLTALPHGAPFLILGVLAVYFGFRAPKPAPNSAQAQGLQLEHHKWFDSLPNVTEEQIRAIPMQATNGLLFGRAAIVLVGTALGAAVGGASSFAASLGGCFIALLISSPMFTRATPLDKARWRRFWNGLLLGYWPAYFASFFVSASSPHLNPFGVAFVCASVVGIIVGFSNVKFRDQQDKNVVIQYFRSKQPSA